MWHILFPEEKMWIKLDFPVFFLIYFASAVAHYKGEKTPIDEKSVDPNEDKIHLALNNDQTIVCYDYTGQVSLIYFSFVI